MWERPNIKNYINCGDGGSQIWVLTNDSNDDVILFVNDETITLSGKARQKLIDLLQFSSNICTDIENDNIKKLYTQEKTKKC